MMVSAAKERCSSWSQGAPNEWSVCSGWRSARALETYSRGALAAHDYEVVVRMSNESAARHNCDSRDSSSPRAYLSEDDWKTLFSRIKPLKVPGSQVRMGFKSSGKTSARCQESADEVVTSGTTTKRGPRWLCCGRVALIPKRKPGILSNRDFRPISCLSICCKVNTDTPGHWARIRSVPMGVGRTARMCLELHACAHTEPISMQRCYAASGGAANVSGRYDQSIRFRLTWRPQVDILTYSHSGTCGRRREGCC